MRAGRQAMQAILESPPRDDADLVEPTPSALGVFASRAVTLLLVAGPLVAFVLAVTFLWGSLFNVGDLALAAGVFLVNRFRGARGRSPPVAPSHLSRPHRPQGAR